MHRHRPGEDRPQGPAAARPHVPHRHRAGSHRRGRRDQAHARRRSSRTRSGSSDGMIELDELPEREHMVFSHTSVLRRQQMFGYTHEELKMIVAPDGEGGRRADRLDGHRHADRRAQRAVAPAVRLLPAAVRAGHQPAARRDPRGGRHRGQLVGRARGEPARARPGELPSAGAAVPDHRQRRAGQDHPHQRRDRASTARTRPAATTSAASTASPAAAWR